MRKNLVTVMVSGREIALSTFVTEDGSEILSFGLDGNQFASLHLGNGDPTLLACTGPSYSGDRLYVDRILIDDGSVEPTERSFCKFIHVRLKNGKKPMPTEDGEEA